MTVHLIRHGKTAANEKRLYCGSSDVPLSENGTRELWQLKDSIVYPKADIVVVSGLIRTKQTADILYDSPACRIWEGFNELCFGDFEMKSYEELKNKLEYQRWISAIDREAPPNGEGKSDFINRVMRSLTELVSACEGAGVTSAAVITHGGVIATIMESLCPGQKNFYEWQPTYGRGYSVMLDKNHKIEYSKI